MAGLTAVKACAATATATTAATTAAAAAAATTTGTSTIAHVMGWVHVAKQLRSARCATTVALVAGVPAVKTKNVRSAAQLERRRAIQMATLATHHAANTLDVKNMCAYNTAAAATAAAATAAAAAATAAATEATSRRWAAAHDMAHFTTRVANSALLARRVCWQATNVAEA